MATKRRAKKKAEPSAEAPTWKAVANQFGRDVMKECRDYAFARIPTDASPGTKAIAEQAALDAVYGLMKMLDGVPGATKLGPFSVWYRLEAIVQNPSRDTVAVVELGPDGDGLCLGFHNWLREAEPPTEK